MIQSHDNEFAARFPTIHNCNFSTRDDVRGRDVWSAIVDVFEQGCDDEEVLDALESLEETLAEHAESDSETSVEACEDAEESVQAARQSMRVSANRWHRRDR
jgi:hypothetical protein